MMYEQQASSYLFHNHLIGESEAPESKGSVSKTANFEHNPLKHDQKESHWSAAACSGEIPNGL